MKYILFIIIFLSPLPFGSARPIWQWLWVELIALAAISICIYYLIFEKAASSYRENSLFTKQAFHASVLYIMFLAWGFTQSTFGIGFIQNSEKNWNLSNLHIYYSSSNGLATTCYFAAHMLLFFTLTLSAKSAITCRKYIQLISISTTAYAMYGLVIYYTASDTVLWFKKWSSWNSVSATFVNRNNFAAYVGIGLLCTTALLGQKIIDIIKPPQNHESRLSILLKLYTGDFLAIIVCEIILLLSLILSGSRAGTVSAIIGLISFLLLAFPKNIISLRNWLIFSLISLFTITLGLSGNFLLERFAETEIKNIRYDAYMLFLKIITTSPITGYGIGNFEDIFSYFRTPKIMTLFNRGHNDYIELALTAGIPALIIFLMSILIIIKYTWGGLNFTNHNKPLIALSLAATMQLSVHSLFDFPLQIPAVSYLYVIVLGISYSVSFKSRNPL